jgi:hypothetical protein
VFCCYRCANFAGGILPNRAAVATDWVANLAMSSRRRNFCFLNLLNLALSPFCDDICPRSSNLFVTQRAEDKSVRSSIRQATDGRCEAQGTLRETRCSACGSDCSDCSLAADKMSCSMPAAYSIFRKICQCRCGLGKLGPTQRPSRGSRETGWSQWIDATLAWSLLAGVSKLKVFRGR